MWVFRRKSAELLVTLWVTLVLLVSSATCMYYFEPGFESIGEALWWASACLTTVGYGDVAPITPLGQIIGAITALMGVCTVALLTGIVASAFAAQMSRRKVIFEEEIRLAVSDGVVTEAEKNHIEELRQRFNIPQENAKKIFEIISDKKV